MNTNEKFISKMLTTKKDDTQSTSKFIRKKMRARTDRVLKTLILRMDWNRNTKPIGITIRIQSTLTSEIRSSI